MNIQQSGGVLPGAEGVQLIAMSYKKVNVHYCLREWKGRNERRSVECMSGVSTTLWMANTMNQNIKQKEWENW